MRLRKISAFMTVGILMASTTLCACGGSKKAATKSTHSEKTLTIGLQSSSFVTDYKNNYLTKYLEKKLGAKLKFYMLPANGDEIKTKVSLMVTNGEDMPDVFIFENVLSPETILDYGTKGAFISLNDYIKDKKQSPNFNRMEKVDKDKILEGITSANGNIYSLPKYTPMAWNTTRCRMYLNKAWLDKLGLQVPKTTEELHTVLKAFHEKDPNGNGQQDEIGLYGGSTPIAIMNSFIFTNGVSNGGLTLDESGKVIAPYTTDQWKAGLTYMHKLYTEGLLDSTVFTPDENQIKATLNADTNVTGFMTTESTSRWTDADKNKNYNEMQLIAPLKGPEGVAYTAYADTTVSNEFFITSACKNPDLAFKLGDLFLDPDVGKIARYGEEGVDWSGDPEKIEKDATNPLVNAKIYDKISLDNLNNIWVQQQSKTWRDINPRYFPQEMQDTAGYSKSYTDPNAKTQKEIATSYKIYFKAHPDKILPLLHYTLDEVSDITQAMTDIPDYVEQSMAEFVIGQRDIDKDWKAYLDELDNMGLKEWLKTAQSAYKRMEK